MCVWSLSGPLFNGGPGGGRTLCVLSFVLLDNRPLTPGLLPAGMTGGVGVSTGCGDPLPNMCDTR